MKEHCNIHRHTYTIYSLKITWCSWLPASSHYLHNHGIPTDGTCVRAADDIWHISVILTYPRGQNWQTQRRESSFFSSVFCLTFVQDLRDVVRSGCLRTLMSQLKKLNRVSIIIIPVQTLNCVSFCVSVSCWNWCVLVLCPSFRYNVLNCVSFVSQCHTDLSMWMKHCIDRSEKHEVCDVRAYARTKIIRQNLLLTLSPSGFYRNDRS